jgi:hypothetical protein
MAKPTNRLDFKLLGLIGGGAEGPWASPRWSLLSSVFSYCGGFDFGVGRPAPGLCPHSKRAHSFGALRTNKVPAAHRNLGPFESETETAGRALYCQHDQPWRSTMPILLLVGVPVVLLGGGYFIIHAMH